LPFLLVLPFYSCANVGLPINISFKKAISLCSWLDLFMAFVMMSSFIALPLLRLLPIPSTFSLASYSPLLFFLFFFPLLAEFL
jgi:hypothetical protein